MKTKLSVVALAALLFAGLPLASSSAYVGVSVSIAPPAIPIYQQPYCPAPGYLWTPGYWDYANVGYYWVPGVWVRPPRIGFLWTPGYWGFNNGAYLFNRGYWGPTVGFYGGINYGYGYGGRGYYGGEWRGNTFRYNTAVTRVNRSVIRNTYVNREAVNRNKVGSRAGFNGPGGANARANAQERAAAKGKHIAPTSAQRSRAAAAKKDPALHAKNNKGKPNARAVNGFNQNDRKPRAAAAANANTKKQAGARNQANASQRANDRSRPKAKANQNRAASTQRSAQRPRQATSARRPAPRAQSTARNRPQAQSRSAPRRQAGPARGQAQQNAKKKKRKNGPEGR